MFVFAVKEGKIFSLLQKQGKKAIQSSIQRAQSMYFSFLLDERKFSKEKFALWVEDFSLNFFEPIICRNNELSWLFNNRFRAFYLICSK